MPGPYTEFPNKKWNIEVSKPLEDITSLDGVIKQLLKHTKQPEQICIIQARNRSFIVLRKAEEGEEEMISDKHKNPLIARIIKIY